MIKPGLVSVAFRALLARDVIDLAQKAGLDGIEWGGDIHVPHGDLGTAHELGILTRQAGLAIVNYGSYYRAGHADDLRFEIVLETAQELEAPSIRVWAGKLGSDQADQTYRKKVMDDLIRIGQMAGAVGIGLVLEYHTNTLTDCASSAMGVLELCSRFGVKSLWQPRTALDHPENSQELEVISPWFAHSHVFSWTTNDAGGVNRLPLCAHREQWQDYLKQMNQFPGTHYALLEFVAGDDPFQFKQDAACLLKMIEQIEKPKTC